ncbi:MAG: excinuclease ABC subunit UvrA [Verrucomicrobiae bacterium]|nr:excinuclease ABC subunit UvrA [Verrucomicrobiae bacterium]
MREGNQSCIHLRGVSQNNLRGFDLDIPLGKLTVVTGVSGSGKSSLVFDTLYAEGQRRYVETFSPYARQFMERLDQPRVKAIGNIPPAIAIQQGNTVKTSRSTVGTLTELCDHFKLLMAHAAEPVCPQCGKTVRKDSSVAVAGEFAGRDAEMLVVFSVSLSKKAPFFSLARVLMDQGYRRWWSGGEIRELAAVTEKTPLGAGEILVVQDRLRGGETQRTRWLESLEAAFRAGKGHLSVITLEDKKEHRFSRDLHCAACDRSFATPTPALFSFNHPLAACPRCRGFGRTVEIDRQLVIPNPQMSVKEGVIKPWQTGISAECQRELMSYCRRRAIDTGRPFARLPRQHQEWIWQGDEADPGATSYGPWYGVKGYFEWLESKSYKMHMRVLLSRYRVYRTCPDCKGSRFQPETLHYRLGGKNLAELYAMPAKELGRFLGEWRERQRVGRRGNDPRQMVADAIASRLRWLEEVGLGYLSLNRAARTLSGGEVQRVHLTSCLGGGMVNTLFILDEPSVGLHPRDIDRLLKVLCALRDQGNTLVVVEHDPQVIRSADHWVDLGPGAGEGGGRLLFSMPPGSGVPKGKSLTWDYLNGRRAIEWPKKRREVNARTPHVRVENATENNLENLTVEFPLRRFVAVTGVSGSGKSTLVQRVLYENLQQLMGRTGAEPGCCRRVAGHEALRDVVLVDQSPLSRTSRSNPAVYVGAWEFLRRLFGALPESQTKGFSAGTFSFNAGDGRCLRCGGNGSERVEMQFLADVFLPCPACRGRRFRDETLAIRLGDWNAADWLGQTVAEARRALADLRDGGFEKGWLAWRDQADRRLALLEQVGLGYLRLGQPLPTLSGGEAQRLKLCGYLAETLSEKGGVEVYSGKFPSKNKGAESSTLLIFDEPTTGLHFEDVRQLVAVFQQLVDRGFSLVVIEHNLELIKCADWIIDLGPEAGDEGGHLVASGSPEDLMRVEGSWTGRFLKKLASNKVQRFTVQGSRFKGEETENKKAVSAIRIVRARENNLKNLSLDIPRDQWVVVTGLSGSGKSSLAFDLVFNEGQRRFLDCMSAYARQYVEQMPRADVDWVAGIPPTVAIEQRVTQGGWRSTVATVTEAYHFIRLLYARVGEQYCPRCRTPVGAGDFESALSQIAETIRRQGPQQVRAPLIWGRKGFHSDVAAWAAGKGFSRLWVDGRPVEIKSFQKLARYVVHDIDLDGGIWTDSKVSPALVEKMLGYGKGTLRLVDRKGRETLVSSARACPECRRSFAPLDPRDFSFNSPSGWCESCRGYGFQPTRAFDEDWNAEESIREEAEMERRQTVGQEVPCRGCEGARLKPEALAVRLAGKTVAELQQMPVRMAADWFRKLKFEGRKRLLAQEAIAQVIERLGFLDRVGLEYLQLGRSAHTLSGGEMQRIRLAAQLGSNLRGVLYVLDEPTIGLHSRDNEKLLEILDGLKRRGNSLLVVEHDEETIRRADWVIDLGPGAGQHGGEAVWQGRVKNSGKGARGRSLTLDFLQNPMRHPMRGQRRSLKGIGWLVLRQASWHNLRRVTARFPVGRLTMVTGVSGAGKSSLVRGCLLPSVAGARRAPAVLDGRGLIGQAYEVDQSPIGRTPRSCPATYVGVWDEIRRLFAATSAARLRGFNASRFSFNTGEGRCEKCVGQGRLRMEMNFLPDAFVPCEVCEGKRFNSATLEVTYRDRNIDEVLRLSVEDAAAFFAHDRKVAEPLKLLSETGLGYLSLGQSSPTLSGGEAQRLKLVTELARGMGGRPRLGSLYVLEEPTIGLHFADVEKLIGVLHRLVDEGHTVVVIEHNLDVIAEADYVLDLGPEGGDRGGKAVVCGTPEDVARCPASHTGRFLRRVL